MKRLFVFCCALLLMTGYTQNSWVVKNPFDQKCFIENNGQFRLEGEHSDEKILFGNWVNGIHYYFSKDKFFLVYPIKKEKMGNELSEEKELKHYIEYHTICISILNTHKECFIAKNELLTEYYNYNDNSEKGSLKTIHANAFKRITYQNIYPNINLSFSFAEKEKGLKYYFEVKPGGDIGNIQFSITGDETKSAILKNGDLSIVTPIGEFIDQAPFANYVNNQKKIGIRYSLKKNIVSFDVDNFDKTEGIIIDPWLIDPILPGSNKGFDVDYDSWGNVYVFGGDALPLQLQKYSPAGALIWSYNYSGGIGYYGDFAVDRKSGSVYIVDGYNTPGATVNKLNQLGNLVANYPGNPNFLEMWRIVFSTCTNQAIIGGGGTSDPTYQACYLDTNLSSLNLVNILGIPDCCHDVCCLAVDNYGYCYPWFVVRADEVGIGSNEIRKVPALTLSPTVLSIDPNSYMIEATSPIYHTNTENGFNGSTVFEKSLYGYDSHELRRWNTDNGLLLANLVINPSIDTTQVSWCGISVDPCGDVYIGDKNKVSQYDSTLNFKFDYPCPNSIYDVQFGNNTIYASGLGFLTAISPQPLSCSNSAFDVTVTVNQSNCGSEASASVTINGGGVPPYNVMWNTVPPATGTSISNLQPDTIIVTVTDNSCIPKVFSDTIIITASQTGSNAILTTLVETNTFTPNADNTNDLFYGFKLTSPTIAQEIKNASKEYSFTVYNRWGTIVYRTNNPTQGWNGMINNVESTEGVYFWVIDIIPTCDGNLKHTYQNNVTLFR